MTDLEKTVDIDAVRADRYAGNLCIFMRSSWIDTAEGVTVVVTDATVTRPEDVTSLFLLAVSELSLFFKVTVQKAPGSAGLVTIIFSSARLRVISAAASDNAVVIFTVSFELYVVVMLSLPESEPVGSAGVTSVMSG